MIRALAALLVLTLTPLPAQAEWVEMPSISSVVSRMALEAPRKSLHRHERVRPRYPTAHTETPSRGSVRGYGRRPRKWCGWYMRQVKGVKDPSFNRARHWLNYGKPTIPQVGAVVVWPHHVGYIVGRGRNGWIVRSGNWNNRVADVPLNRMGRNVIGYRI